MNIPDYLESGILESYVLGVVNDQERREVHCLASIYPEVQAELDRLSSAMEDYALLYSKEPPADLKDTIMSKLDFASESPETIVRPMPVAAQTTGGPTYNVSWMVAASVGLLVLVFSFFLFKQLRQTQQETTAMRSDNRTLQDEVHTLRERQAHSNELLSVLQQPGMKIIELKGNEKAPDSQLFVYWNTHTQQVTVEVGTMPDLPGDQQYQLWSLVDGKPVNAGVFDAGKATGELQRLQSIGRADAFAVTVEKRGGSPTPNLSALVAMQPLKS